MKRFFLFATFVALIATSCSQFVEEDTIALPSRGDKFTAYFEDASRTYVEQGKYMRWHEGDLLTIFFASTLNRQYKFDGKTGDNSGTFTEVDDKFGAGNSIERNYALYPYNAATTFDDATNTISATLPEVQHYAENSFGKGANTMVAVTESGADKVLSFKNVCGYLKLQLYGEATTIKSIVLNGNNGEKLAGAGVITAAYGEEPTIAMAEAAGESVALDCGEGVTIGATAEEATTFWFALPPTTFEKGFTVTVYNTANDRFRKITSKNTTIERNIIQPMAAVEVECVVAKPANNEIWYTSTDGNIITPNATDVFGANIVSNTYENGQGLITFDGDVTKIGYEAFYWHSSLTSITIPNSVTSIGGSAFWCCSKLVSINIPDSVTSIGNYAFYDCSSLTSVTIPDRVTSIGGYTFYGCSSLTSVTIPDSVTFIGDKAFAFSHSLISATIGNGVTTIRSGAFESCEKLTAFYGKFASDDNRCLIVQGVLNSFAPYGLTEYTIPDGTTSIGGAVFSYHTKLISITIPDSVTSIGNNAFYGCNSLAKMTIGNSVAIIGQRAFVGCENLTSVTIPASVTSIGELAFYDCTSLTEVYCKPTTPPIGGTKMFCYNDNQYYERLIGCNIYVPNDSVEAYKAAEYWSDYKDYIFGTDSFDLPPFGSEEGEMVL